MSKLKPLLTLALLLAALLTRAQTTTPKTDPEPAYIEVNGTAEKEVVPDEIYIRIVIRERYAGKTKVTLEEQEEKLKAAVRTLGIDAASLTLSDANADYVRIRRQQKDVLTRKDYQLKVGDAATTGRVFAELDRLEITDASIARVSHSQLQALRKEVKIMAIKAAKDKADYLLTAIGERTGKALIVREYELSESGLPPAARGHLSNVSVNASLPDGYNSAADDELQFQKVRIQSTIYVKFAIK